MSWSTSRSSPTSARKTSFILQDHRHAGDPGRHSRNAHSHLVEPTKEGRYQINCAQLCGNAHSAMTAGTLVVESQPAFDKWLASKVGPPLPASSSPTLARAWRRRNANPSLTRHETNNPASMDGGLGRLGVGGGHTAAGFSPGPTQAASVPRQNDSPHHFDRC